MQAVEIQAARGSRIDQGAVPGPGLGGNVPAGDYLGNGQAQHGGKLIVTGIVRRHRHNRTRTVAGEHVVSDEDRHLLAVDRVGGIGAQEYTGLILIFLTLQVRLRGDCGAVGLHGLLRVIVAIGPALVDVVLIRNR